MITTNINMSVLSVSQFLANKGLLDFNREDFRRRIIYTENRGALKEGRDLYSVVGRTGDLGKYQVKPQTLADWSPYWLGRKYSPEEFLKDKKAQEEFFDQFLAVRDRLKLNSQQTATAWHTGWGELGSGKPREVRDKEFLTAIDKRTKENTDYLNTFNSLGLEIPKYAKPNLNTDLKLSAKEKEPFDVAGYLGEKIPILGKVQRALKPVFNFLAPQNKEEAQKFGLINIGSEQRPTYIDPTGFVGGLESVSNRITSKIAQKIAKSGIADDIFKFLKSGVKNVSDDVLREMSQGLVKVTNPNEVKPFVNESLTNLTKRAEGLFTRIKPPSNSLFEEARKYKSAEEFVNSQYKTADQLKKQGLDIPKASQNSLFKLETRSIDELQQVDFPQPYEWKTEYGLDMLKSVKKGETPPIVAKLDGTILDGNHRYEAYIKNNIKEAPVFTEIKETKSQLTDIWNRAVGKTVNKVERGFITSAKQAIPEAQRIKGQYIPRSTDNLAIKAKNLIKENIDLAEKMALSGTDDKAVATASELLKHYSEKASKATDQVVKNALYDKAAQVANTIAPKLTEQGRSIQAASILGRLTPEGQVKFAASQISKYNEGVSIAKRIPELTGEQAQHILREMRTINAMEEGLAKAKRFQELQDYIKRLVPTPLIKKAITIWKAGLLTGLKTSGVNIFANTSHAGTEVAKDIPATIADKVFSLFTGKRTVSFNTKGVLEGLGEGAGKGWQYLKTGFDERNIAAKLDYEKVNFGKGKIANALQAYTDTVFRVLGTEDQPFYYSAKIRSLYEQAKVAAINKGLRGQEAKSFITNLIENPTDQMIKLASIDAETAVFQNTTTLSRLASGATRAVPTTEIIMPFKRTPSAVAMQIINYTPVGAVNEIVKQIGKKEFNQRALSQAIGRSITGLSALGLGAYLFKNGLVTTSRPKGEREQKQWELEGKQPNSIKVGGKWRQIQVLGPAGNVLLVGASFQKAYEDTGTITGSIAQGAADATQSFTQQTFLTGVSNFIDAISDPARSAPYVLGSTIASTVPTIVADTARATDEYERRTETIFERFLTRVPGLRQTLEPRVDVLGEKVETQNPLETMIDPSRPSKAKDSPVISELRRLSDAGFKVSPTLLGDRKGYKSLTQEQNTKLWERVGEIISGKLSNLFKSPEYQLLDDEQKSKKIDNFVDKAKTSARAEAVLNLTQGLQGEELDQMLSELKASGLMTRAVFNLWKEIR